MKKMSVILVLVMNFGWAETSWIEKSIKVEPKSQIQVWIDQIYEQVLTDSHNRQLVCDLFYRSTDLYYSLGISAESSAKIYSHCQSDRPKRTSKILQKTYYISPESHSHLESWTDFGNRTFLFLDEFSSFEDLRVRLIHEFAMTFDAKMNMLYTTYVEFENAWSDSIVLDKLTNEQKNLQIAFSKSLWYPVARSFAALRAYQVENLLLNNQLDILPHSQCVTELKTLISLLKMIQEPAKPQSAEIMLIDISDFVSKKQIPRNEAEEQSLLEFLMNEKLRVSSREYGEVSFCQYMSMPLMSSKSRHTIYANGPRPRVTGGAGGEGVGSARVQHSDNNTLRLEVQNIKNELNVKKNNEQQKILELNRDMQKFFPKY